MGQNLTFIANETDILECGLSIGKNEFPQVN